MNRKKHQHDYGKWALAILVAFLLVIVALVMSYWSAIPIGDTRLYYHYANLIWGGAMPYGDVKVEYPPGVLPFILLAKIVGRTFNQYLVGFLILSVGAVSIVLWDQFRRGGKKALALSVILIAPVLAYIFFLLDVFAATALYGSILLVFKSKRIKLAAVLFAISVLVKGYPIVCLPALIIAIQPSRRKIFSFTFVSAIIAGILPFLVIAPKGMSYAVNYHLSRPIQAESVPAAVGHIIHIMGVDVGINHANQTWALSFPNSLLVGLVFGLMGLGAFIGVTFLLMKSKKPIKLATSCLVLLLIYTVSFKVGSPQFFVPVIFTALLSMNELSKKNQGLLAIRLFVLGLVIFAILSFGLVGLFNNQWYGGFLIIIKSILLIELLIWAFCRLDLINKKDFIKKPKNSATKFTSKLSIN
ncbi:MAG: hypothetical protein WCP03_02340 [Candidatus Saccharibacteria bacterium]